LTKRKSLSKKMRFEVFKRDSFKCQYCGKPSPDVVLQVDHIKPVTEGGTNDITNLITSCIDCNQGKGATLLDDQSVLEKQRKQLEELNERRLQLEMMMQWREGLIHIQEDKVNIIKERWSDRTGYTPNEHGEKEIKKWLRKFDLNLILDSLEISADQYLETGKNGDYKPQSVEKAFNYIPRICANKKREEEEPELKELYYIRGILRNRLNYFDDVKGLQMLKDAYQNNASLESLKDLALNVKHWSDFRCAIEDFLERVKDE
jgi:hypothetical protein